MKGLLQSPGGKVDNEEGSLEAAIRECKEETNIDLDPKWTRYIGKDTEYDCDIFISKVNEYPKRTEPTNMGEWRPYTFQEYLLRTKKGELTPSHLKFYEKILGKIYVHNMEMKVENDEITWEDKQVAYVGELAEDYDQKPPEYEDRYSEYRGHIQYVMPYGTHQPLYQPHYPPPGVNPRGYGEIMQQFLSQEYGMTGYEWPSHHYYTNQEDWKGCNEGVLINY